MNAHRIAIELDANDLRFLLECLEITESALVTEKFENQMDGSWALNLASIGIDHWLSTFRAGLLGIMEREAE